MTRHRFISKTLSKTLAGYNTKTYLLLSVPFPSMFIFVSVGVETLFSFLRRLLQYSARNDSSLAMTWGGADSICKLHRKCMVDKSTHGENQILIHIMNFSQRTKCILMT